MQNKYYACSSLHANSVRELQHSDVPHKSSIRLFSSFASTSQQSKSGLCGTKAVCKQENGMQSCLLPCHFCSILPLSPPYQPKDSQILSQKGKKKTKTKLEGKSVSTPPAWSCTVKGSLLRCFVLSHLGRRARCSLPLDTDLTNCESWWKGKAANPGSFSAKWLQRLQCWWNLILFVHVSLPPWESWVNMLLLRTSQSDTGVKPKPNHRFALPKRKQRQNCIHLGLVFLTTYLAHLSGSDLSNTHPSQFVVSTVTIRVVLN